MSDLETTAHEAVAKVQPLIDALDASDRECQASLRAVHEMREQLAADQAALQRAVAALHQEAEQSEQMLAELAGGASSNLEDLGAAAAAASSAWTERADKEDEAMVGGAQLLSDLGDRVRELAAQADATRQGVLQWTSSLGEHLEHTIEEVEQAISVEIVAGLADWRRDAEAAVQRVVDFLEKDCADLLGGKEDEWKERLPQALELLDKASQEIAAHRQEIASHVAGRWDELFAAQIERVKSQVATVEEELGILRQSAQEIGAQMRAATDAICDLQQRAGGDSIKLAEGFAATRARWAAMGVTR